MTYQMVQRKEFPPLFICLHQLLQSTSKSRNSYLKDTTDFINYTFEKKVKIEHFLFRLTGHKSWQLHHKTRAFKQFAEGKNFCKFKATLLFLNTLPAGNANRLILIKRTFFYSSVETASPQYRDEHKDSSFVCQHFHGIYWYTNSKQTRL